METLLIRCPECSGIIDLGTKQCETYKKCFGIWLNTKCIDCDTIIAETDVDFYIIDLEKQFEHQFNSLKIVEVK